MIKFLKIGNLVLACFLFANIHAQTLFNKGVNLTGWFQCDNSQVIPFTKYTKDDLNNLKFLGCDVFRLPVNLHEMSSGSPDYIVDPTFFGLMDSVVNWSEQLGLKIIIDNHSFDPNVNTTPDVETILGKVWPQIANHYKNYGNFLYYEILNEPHGISTLQWGSIQQNIINAIRAVDQKHTIIVGGSDFNTYTELANLPYYSDTNLIYTFHFYDPFMFTHQGADWFEPSMASLSGVPFPYDPGKMPPCPADLVGTWVEESLNNYLIEGTSEYVKSLIDIAVEFSNNRHVPVYCGEFGVFIPNADTADRVRWYKLVRQYLEEKGIPWTTWDYQDGFGLFKKGSNELFDHDLNIPLLEALGLNIPAQTPYSPGPDIGGLKVYTDYLEHLILDASYGGSLSYYSTNLPDNDRFCIQWKDFTQYSAIGFDFAPDHDFSGLVNANYALDFMVRGNGDGLEFEARFVDSKTTDPEDHPWRKGITVNSSFANWDKRWHHVHIPLTSFVETGSWDEGNWYEPEGKFDWKAIDKLEFSTESAVNLTDELWFDNITITNLDTAIVRQTGTLSQPELTAGKLNETSIYPNPMDQETTISYVVPEVSEVAIDILTFTGIRIRSLLNEKQQAGAKSIVWNGCDGSGSALPGGTYICRIRSGFSNSTCLIIKR